MLINTKGEIFMVQGSMPIYKAASVSGSIPIFNSAMAPGARAVYEYAMAQGSQAVYEYAMAPNSQAVYYAACFPKSELVHISQKESIPIGALKVGDKLISWDAECEKTLYTAVTEIHEYKVYDIFCINGNLKVSCSHPFMVMEISENGLLTPTWKISYDLKVGDIVVGSNGTLTTVDSKSRHWYTDGIKVLNLSTDCGAPFMVGGCVVKADNTIDKIKLSDAEMTQELLIA